jgi:hypothetical protein
MKLFQSVQAGFPVPAGFVIYADITPAVISFRTGEEVNDEVCFVSIRSLREDQILSSLQAPACRKIFNAGHDAGLPFRHSGPRFVKNDRPGPPEHRRPEIAEDHSRVTSGAV